MKIQRYFSVLIAALLLLSCGGDESLGDGFTISVDKTAIEADGRDAAIFIVKDSKGENVMLNEDIAEKVYFVNAADQSRLPRLSTSFSSIRNGEYTFYATIKGEKTLNTVTIKVQNRSLYEKYLQKVGVYQLTGAWCVNCPSMTEGLTKLRNSEYGENVIVMACHINDRFSILIDGKDLSTEVCNYFGHNGAVPHAFYDMIFQNSARAESQLKQLIAGQLLQYPATCGVKVNSSGVDGSGNITISASVKADRDAHYDLGYAILADNQPGQSGDYEAVYNDVLVAVSSNFVKINGSSAVSLKAGEEHTKTFTVKVDGYKASDLKVVVFAHSDANTNDKGVKITMVDNANICKLGESVDYALNE